MSNFEGAWEQRQEEGKGAVPPLTEAEIEEIVARERARLEAEAGVAERRVEHFHRPVERPFTKAERPKTTILFGGLTWKHEYLVHGALEGLGYNVEMIPTPDVSAFQTGKEFGNNGQCNPTYFTVGNLVQYLQRLEAKGLSRQEILDRYIFLTAGACGPCRFGMYEAEFRLALRNAGFDGFRVQLFQQKGGLNQAELEAGLEMNLDFFLGIVNALNIGDLINDVAYQIRPYEVNAGETDRVLEACMEDLHEVMKRHEPFSIEGRLARLLERYPRLRERGETLGKFFTQLYGEEYTEALSRAGARFDAIRVDRTRPKPIVKVTGEFWAQTTEGDGNFNMFTFLEREGAQVVVEPIGTWLMYMLHQAKGRITDRTGLDRDGTRNPLARFARWIGENLDARQKLAKLSIAEAIFRREWNRLRAALGNLPHPLTDQLELQRMGHPFYNSKAQGGEGHLEVAKNIYYHNKDLCHMVLSVKPFGCMPSTQSDGAQAAVTSLFRDMIYLPIETSGEGEINAHSRVQMALGEAKAKTKEEFARALSETDYTLEEIRAYVEARPELCRPFHPIPHRKGVVGVAANFVLHVGERMRREGIGRRRGGAA